MKRLKYLIAAAVFLTAALLCFTSCFDDGSQTGSFGKGSKTGSSDITISEPVFGFVSEEDYDPGAPIDTSHKWTSLNVDTAYYLFLSLDITAARDNDGQSLIDINITFDSLNIMEGTIEDVNTGIIENLIFTDAVTGNIGKTTTASFKIPASSADTKTISMTIKLRPVNVGESHIIIGYNYNSPEDCRILGSDGYTKNLQINQVKIDTPTLEVNSMGLLLWKQPKNADYYMIYENGNPICDSSGNPIVIEGAGFGSEVYYNIGNSISGYHVFSIRGFSNNKNILPSDFSNIVAHEW